ncbi:MULTISPECIES: sensor histidine kinase [Cryobacterium]|uniref:Histidine kinase n=1 Tax=Cryobacterium zongtaii TaxID=1259217 RepID=A0A2S3ZM19_9MICO|nr:MULTISPECIES: histidine kinase [Cryobacterium]POH69542.1 histidine kinase [Cryobacterium zongtaii]POH70583.1 histidine kinase [Cryobacterium zongtaii]TFC47348.1 histidine kinase [Cryobacterium sp. TMN-39-2]
MPDALTRESPRPAGQARSVHTTWTYTLASIVFFFVVLDSILLGVAASNFEATEDGRDAALIVLILVCGAMHVRYCWFLRVGRGGGMPRLAWTVALIVPAVTVWLLGLATPGAGLFAAFPLWMGLNAIAPLLPRARRWTVLVGGAAVTLAHPLLASSLFGHPLEASGISGVWLLFTYGAFLPMMVLSSLWWWEIVVTLDRHRSVAAELAVAHERLRFASDLHDIQGHHLQVIALKSELAERLLSIDPDAAREHLHETRLIAKQALEETRSLVAGYRQVDLATELENAREVLTASGADCALELGVLPAGIEVRRVLALVVREATTNILRHSTASKAAITLSTNAEGSTLEVVNNAASPATDAPGRVLSSGLTGLRDRVAAIGGHLVTESDGDTFVLRAFVAAGVGVGA